MLVQHLLKSMIKIWVTQNIENPQISHESVWQLPLLFPAMLIQHHSRERTRLKALCLIICPRAEKVYKG